MGVRNKFGDSLAPMVTCLTAPHARYVSFEQVDMIGLSIAIWSRPSWLQFMRQLCEDSLVVNHRQVPAHISTSSQSTTGVINHHGRRLG